jgi:hypothetical protein
MHMRPLLVIVVGLFMLDGCWVDVPDPTGRACELPAHPCAQNETCVDGHCTTQSIPGWRQVEHGFDTSGAAPGCAVDIEQGAANRLTATTTAAVTVGQAAGIVTSHMFVGPAGRLRGKLALGRAVPADGELKFLCLRNTERKMLFELALTDHQLVVHVAAGTLNDDELLNGLDTASREEVIPLVTPGIVNELEIVWAEGQGYRLWINGLMSFSQLPPMPGSPHGGSPDELTLGMCGLTGTFEADSSIVLSEWEVEPVTPPI